MEVDSTQHGDGLDGDVSKRQKQGINSMLLLSAIVYMLVVH